MKRRLSLLGIFAAVVLACSMIFVGCTENSVNSTIRYYGKVVHSGSTDPYANLEVKVTDGDKIHCFTYTDNNGDFSLTVNVDEIDEYYYLLIGNTTSATRQIPLSGFGHAEVNVGIVEISDKDQINWEQASVFYIKHPWYGLGWKWKKMNIHDSAKGVFRYTDFWGDAGAYINTSANDKGAKWFEKDEIGNSDMWIIQEPVTFVFNPTTMQLSTEMAPEEYWEEDNTEDEETETEQPNWEQWRQATNFYIKHPWESGDWTWKKMEDWGDENFYYVGYWGESGAYINISANDKGALWYEKDDIGNADIWFSGDIVTFIFNPSTLQLSTWVE